VQFCGVIPPQASCDLFFLDLKQEARVLFVVHLKSVKSDIVLPIWNEMPMSLRKLPKNVFKRKIRHTLFEILTSEDYYIDFPKIVQKLKLNLLSS